MSTWRRTADNAVHENTRRPLEDSVKLKAAIEAELKNADYGHSTDDNDNNATTNHLLNDSEEDDDAATVPEVVARHYRGRLHLDHSSDSAHSPHSALLDEEEEDEKIEQEITSRLSHLTIHREMGRNDGDWDRRWSRSADPDAMPLATDFDLTRCSDTDSLVTELCGDAKEASDDEAEDIRAEVAGSPHCVDEFRLSVNGEFLSNETFIKYAMLYGTIYAVSKLSLNRLYNGGVSAVIDADAISRKMVLISNAVVAVFKGYDIGIGGAPHKAIVRPLSVRNFLDIQKAFNFIMILLSFVGGSARANGRRAARGAQRVYNLICIGCIVLIKKYEKMGGLYIYTAFWLQLSSFFLNSGKVLSKMGALRRMDSVLMRRGGALSKVAYALLTIYSRIYLFSKVMTPVIQQCWRTTGSGMAGSFAVSLASTAFLISGYYRTGDGIIQTLIRGQ